MSLAIEIILVFLILGLYKSKFICYNPSCSGLVVQSVSTPACHAGGRRFESVRGRQKKKRHPFGWRFFFAISEERTRKTKCNCPVGSDASAAGGRKSELSEWQRSKNSRISVSPMNFSGTATGLSQPPWLARRRASPFEQHTKTATLTDGGLFVYVLILVLFDDYRVAVSGHAEHIGLVGSTAGKVCRLGIQRNVVKVHTDDRIAAQVISCFL